jgi:hypothetical protein
MALRRFSKYCVGSSASSSCQHIHTHASSTMDESKRVSETTTATNDSWLPRPDEETNPIFRLQARSTIAGTPYCNLCLCMSMFLSTSVLALLAPGFGGASAAAALRAASFSALALAIASCCGAFGLVGWLVGWLIGVQSGGE